METRLLREPEIFPSKEVLQEALGSEVYSVLEEMQTQLTHDSYALTFDWLYYKDSKGWLCKVSHKKKTVFWLSLWEGFIKITFYFLERHLEGIASLDIDENSYTMLNEWGKMIPLGFDINDIKQLPALLKMVDFKKKSK